ncbi:MAG: acyl-CoA dehydrogenase [Microthrixaceae bacterium]|nr:acyl-CoA dehydrogenase [Microthrixaceae bacterium]MCO5313666.1 acyl-CoA dehydrogenase [Microthrixaceae bacterium]
MTIAITDDHRTLAETADAFLTRVDSKGAARALLTTDDETLPTFWSDLAELGWLGLHLPEEHGGSGYGAPEQVVIIEALARHAAPGPYVPTIVASAAIAASGDEAAKVAWLGGLAAGTTVAAISIDNDLTLNGSGASATVDGDAGVVISGALANVLAIAVGEDLALVDTTAAGITVETPKNLDLTRRSSRITLDAAPATVIAGGARALVDYARLYFAAEAMGIARETTDLAAAYANERLQFGRVIGTYQAVKHHCANMAVGTELATAAVWDAARAEASGGDQLSISSAIAATLAIGTAEWNCQLCMQVHGGIGFTWEHDAHIYLRRATAMKVLLSEKASAERIVELARDGVQRERSVDLPPEAEPIRDEVRAFAERVKGLDSAATRSAMLAEGYAMPHWPKPWGRAAGAVEQLVIEEEFKAAGVRKPAYGITGWVILTLIQHANDDQIARWVQPALNQDLIWCQLFSEPDAGSDAAGIKTRATRVDGGWLINGQKVWTSGAHYSKYGFATVRTNPDVPKHQGITMVVIDMEADGVEVRPIKMPSGGSEFNEVFFNDVFVPDDDVVGPVDGGWTVARSTLGNESVSIGGGQGGMNMPGESFIPMHDQHPERLIGGAARIGQYIAHDNACTLLNLRAANRAVAGGEPGPEGAITKLVLSENGHEATAIFTALTGPDAAFNEGPGEMSNMLALWHRGLSIAGGTSEIKRNQIGERILGLPRDPLISN